MFSQTSSWQEEPKLDQAAELSARTGRKHDTHLIFPIRHFKLTESEAPPAGWGKSSSLVLRCGKVSAVLTAARNHQHGTCGGGWGRWGSSQEEARHRDHREPLSGPEDPEPAPVHPPSRSRLAQPCRQKAPSPPRLRRRRRRRQSALCRTFCSKLPIRGWLAVTKPEQQPESSSPGIILIVVLTSFQFWACSNFQSRMKLLLSVTTGPWETDRRKSDLSRWFKSLTGVFNGNQSDGKEACSDELTVNTTATVDKTFLTWLKKSIKCERSFLFSIFVSQDQKLNSVNEKTLLRVVPPTAEPTGLHLPLYWQPSASWPPLRSAWRWSWRQGRTPWGSPRWERPSSTAGPEPWSPSWEENTE